MKNLFFLLIIAIIGIGIFIFAGKNNEPPLVLEEVVGTGKDIVTVSEDQLRIGNTTYLVDIADTSEERYQGLSGRSRLNYNRGMLFLFPKADIYGFWMKDMNFSIDIVWISGDRIVGITEDLDPDSSPTPRIYYPPTLVDKVLEVNAGQAQRNGIKVGDLVEFSLSDR